MVVTHRCRSSSVSAESSSLRPSDVFSTRNTYLTSLFLWMTLGSSTAAAPTPAHAPITTTTTQSKRKSLDATLTAARGHAVGSRLRNGERTSEEARVRDRVRQQVHTGQGGARTLHNGLVGD